MVFNPYDTAKYPKRKNPRLKGYDYSSPNHYFITICTHEKACLFGRPDSLNPYGQIAAQGLRDIPLHYPNVDVDHFVVMPNHVHAIIHLNSGNANLERVIGSYKSYVTKKIHEIDPDQSVWQESFHDHIIRDERSYQKIWQYIEGNPLNREKDCFYLR